MPFVKVDNNTLGEIKEITMKHNIPLIKRKLQLLEKKKLELENILQKAENVGIVIS